MTLVRNDDGLLPLRLAADARVAVVQPRPVDLTPADTSSYVPPMLAERHRLHHPAVEFVRRRSREPAEGGLLGRLARPTSIVLGTVSANMLPAQAELARAVLALGLPTVTIALRTPWDLLAYPLGAHTCLQLRHSRAQPGRLAAAFLASSRSAAACR